MNLHGAHSLLVNAFGWALNTSMAATVLGLIVWLVQRVFRRQMSPRAFYWLWMLVAARLLMPVVPGSHWSLFNWVRLPTAGNPPGEITARSLPRAENPARPQIPPVASDTPAQTPPKPASLLKKEFALSDAALQGPHGQAIASYSWLV